MRGVGVGQNIGQFAVFHGLCSFSSVIVVKRYSITAYHRDNGFPNVFDTVSRVWDSCSVWSLPAFRTSQLPAMAKLSTSPVSALYDDYVRFVIEKLYLFRYEIIHMAACGKSRFSHFGLHDVSVSQGIGERRAVPNHKR